MNNINNKTNNNTVKASASKVHIKARYNGELRRFALAQASIARLRKRLAALFAVEGETLVLSYLDDEQDLVALKTDDDLKTAMKMGSPVRVTVALSATATPTPTPTANAASQQEEEKSVDEDASASSDSHSLSDSSSSEVATASATVQQLKQQRKEAMQALRAQFPVPPRQLQGPQKASFQAQRKALQLRFKAMIQAQKAILKAQGPVQKSTASPSPSAAPATVWEAKKLRKEAMQALRAAYPVPPRQLNGEQRVSFLQQRDSIFAAFQEQVATIKANKQAKKANKATSKPQKPTKIDSEGSLLTEEEVSDIREELQKAKEERQEKLAALRRKYPNPRALPRGPGGRPAFVQERKEIQREFREKKIPLVQLLKANKQNWATNNEGDSNTNTNNKPEPSLSPDFSSEEDSDEAETETATHPHVHVHMRPPFRRGGRGRGRGGMRFRGGHGPHWKAGMTFEDDEGEDAPYYHPHHHHHHKHHKHNHPGRGYGTGHGRTGGCKRGRGGVSMWNDPERLTAKKQRLEAKLERITARLETLAVSEESLVAAQQ